MNGKQLKNSILQWAIQGKLVPQDPNDEPAGVLLERIRKEKERLIKEKKIKKDKNASIIFRGEDNSYYEKFLATGVVKCIDEEIPFEIPSSWEWTRISSIFQLNPRVEANDNMLAAFIPMEAISAVYGSDYHYYERKWKEIKSGFTQFADGDIAFAKITPCFQNRKSAVFSNLPNGIGAGTTELKVLRPYGETINRFYTLYFLESPYFIDEATFKGTANQQRIVVGYLENKLFPLPPIEEQCRIAGKIAEVLPIADRYGKTQTKLDNLNVELKNILKKSVLQEAIQGKLVPQIEAEGTAQELLEQIQQEKQKLAKEGKLKKSALNDSIIFKGDDNKYWEKIGKEVRCIDDEIPFDIPSNWVYTRMGNIGDWGSGSTPAKENSDYYGGNILWLRTGELNNGVVNDTEIKITDKALKKCSFKLNKPGDVLIAMYGATIGKVAIAGKEMTTNQACCGCTPFIYNKYLFYFLIASKNDFVRKGEGGAQPNISREKLVSHLIPLPPLKEQYRIVSKIEKLASIMSRQMAK
jgi:type I restriction enzyme S subunit